MKLIERFQLTDEFVALRRDIHAHPELCFQENRTADLVAAQLASWGIEVHRGMGTTGVVGVIKNGTSQRSIGLRADMDALPVQEANAFAHASQHPGKMHACGHDGHTAMLLAAARHLAKHKHFDGTVVLIFQPAEEGGGGAREMIKDGLFKQFPCDEVYGLHNAPDLNHGEIAILPGPAMAAADFFDIRIQGYGAHGAMPERSKDAVVIAMTLQVGLDHFPVFANLPSQLIAVFAGIALVGIGSGFYITCGLGPGPRDGLMTALHQKTGVRVGRVRMSIEILVFLIGALLGGKVGLGTALFALLIGNAVALSFKLVSNFSN